MDREDNPLRRSWCKKVSCLLVILILGFLSSSGIAVLAYFTYQAAVHNIDFCTLWIDIPGRLAIFITSYYVAGICGCFPLPERFRLRWMPKPFTIWRLESWRSLFRNLCFLFSCSANGIFRRLRQDSEVPLLRREHERFDDGLPTGEHLLRTRFPYPNTPIERFKPIGILNNESRPEINNSDESFMSFDSPVGGHIVPMVKGQSSKQHYIPDSSISNSESLNNSFRAMGDLPGPLRANDPREIRASDPQEMQHEGDPDDAHECDSGDEAAYYYVEGDDGNLLLRRYHLQDEVESPARTPDIDLPMPNYPRFPWSILRDSEGIPLLARKLHRKNLRRERQQIDKYNKRQRIGAVRTEKGPTWGSESFTYESELGTSRDDFDLATNPPFCLSRRPLRSRIGLRGRAGTSSANIGDLHQHQVQVHTGAATDVDNESRTDADPPRKPESREDSDRTEADGEYTKCCKDSPDLQFKVDHIRRVLRRFEPDLDKDTRETEILGSRQNMDTAESRQNMDTAKSRQNMDTAESRQNMDTAESRQNMEIEDSRQNMEIEDSKQNMEIEESRQNIRIAESRQNIEIEGREAADRNLQSAGRSCELN